MRRSWSVIVSLIWGAKHLRFRISRAPSETQAFKHDKDIDIVIILRRLFQNAGWKDTRSSSRWHARESNHQSCCMNHDNWLFTSFVGFHSFSISWPMGKIWNLENSEMNLDEKHPYMMSPSSVPQNPNSNHRLRCQLKILWLMLELPNDTTSDPSE